MFLPQEVVSVAWDSIRLPLLTALSGVCKCCLDPIISPENEALLTGHLYHGSVSLSLRITKAVLAETLENIQYSMRRIPKILNHTYPPIYLFIVIIYVVLRPILPSHKTVKKLKPNSVPLVR
jgi:hypothetical protein